MECGHSTLGYLNSPTFDRARPLTPLHQNLFSVAVQSLGMFFHNYLPNGPSCETDRSTTLISLYSIFALFEVTGNRGPLLLTDSAQDDRADRRIFPLHTGKISSALTQYFAWSREFDENF